MNATELPLIPKDLLDALDRRFPEASAKPGQPMDLIMFEGGKRALVQWLKLIYEEQQRPTDENNDK